MFVKTKPMKSLVITLLIVGLTTLSCTKEETPSQTLSGNCQTDASLRRGAKCKDGTTSNATGSGACSSHGGVDYWLCK